MPFRSAAQERFMFSRHPEIARRWVREFGSAQDYGRGSRHMKDVNRPVSSGGRAPSRANAVERDFGGLRPGQSARHVPARANEVEAQKDGPVGFVEGSRHRELGVPERAKGLRGRDVRRAARALG